jgi:hypothetical protein
MRSFLLLLLLATVSAPGAAAAQTWRYEYRASDTAGLPSAGGWSHFVADPAPADGLDESNYSIQESNKLVQGETGGVSFDPGNLQSYQSPAVAFDFDEDRIVVEFEALITSATMTAPGQPNPGAGFGVKLVDADGEQVILFIDDTGLFLYSQSGATSDFYPLDLTDDIDYELRVDPRGAWVRVWDSDQGLTSNWVTVAHLPRADFGSSGDANAMWIGDVSATESSSSKLLRFSISRFEFSEPVVVGYEHLTETSTADSENKSMESGQCVRGADALSGGGEVIGGFGDVALSASQESFSVGGARWVVDATEINSTGADWQLRSDVICGEVHTSFTPYESAPSGSTNPGQAITRGCEADQGILSARVGGPTDTLPLALRRNGLDYTMAGEVRWLASMYNYETPPTTSWHPTYELKCSDSYGFDEESAETATDSTNTKAISVLCPAGRVPISGGAAVTNFAGPEVVLRASRPLDGPDGPTGWYAEAQEITETTDVWSLKVDAICAKTADPTVEKAGLISRYSGDDAAGDGWGLGAGTIQGSVPSVPGILDDAYAFDGVGDDYVEIPSMFPGDPEKADHDLYPEGSYSVGAWIQTTGVPEDLAFIAQLSDFGGLNPGGSNYSTWSLYLDANGYPGSTVRSQYQYATAVTGPDAVTDGEWHHVLAMRDLDPSWLKLYVDGEFVAYNALLALSSAQPLVPGDPANPDPVTIGIGRNTGATTVSRRFDGLIDDVMYWDRALSQEEIQNIAGCGVPIVPRTLNIDASQMSGRTNESSLCLYLEAGAYELTLVTPALDAEARFTGWSAKVGEPWATSYRIVPEIDSTLVAGLQPDDIPPGPSSGQQAYDWTPSKTAQLTLTTAQRVYLSVDDLADGAVLDNQGGVSLQIVPEPGAVLGIVAGAGFLTVLARRRRSTA